MATFSIEILNPKVKKLLFDLAELQLISIKEDKPNTFLSAVKKVRLRKANLTLEKITREVEILRTKRYSKQA